MNRISRRRFLAAAAAVPAAAVCSRSLAAAPARKPKILLRSSWQVVNIGDIAHTPGVLALLEKHIPDAEVVLWASADLSEAVAAMEHKRFPKLRIVKGTIGADGKASNQDLADAVAGTDFLLHGSGPSLVAQNDVAAFAKHTGKPFGVYGITYGGGSAATAEVLGRAKFAYFRDSVSLEKAKADGIKCPVMEFGPDGAFACDLRNDAAADAFLKANGLEEGKFLCCIPRLRYTPYWKIHGRQMTDVQKERAAYNDKMKDADHAPLREAVAAVARQTDLKILLCPEDMSQMEVGKEMILDKLPDDVRKRVVWREKFWLTDEALSTYVRSAGLFGHEMHSPIMCIGNGVPAIVCRWKEQTSKGFMWRDIGLGDWLFDMDKPDEAAKVPAAVLALAKDRDAAKAKAAQALEVVRKRQKETMDFVRAAIGG